MAICSKCGSPVADGMRYCGICANPMVQAPAPVYTPEGPRVPGGVKAQAGVGMGLSIYGFYWALSGLALTLYFVLFGVFAALTGIEGLYVAFLMSLYALIFAAAFSSYSLPMGIVGMILGSGSRKKGNPSKMCSVASGLGLSALIISIVIVVLAVAMFVLGIFGLMIVEANYEVLY